MASGINLLFIGYWSFYEGLTQSTIIPHLKILSSFPQVKKVIFISIEREGEIAPHNFSDRKISHLPLYSKNLPFTILNKINDFHFFSKKLNKICLEKSIDHIICRGSPAGAIGFLVFEKTKISFSVESFEPHAQYMLESGTWKKWDPRYIMQTRWEIKQKENAYILLPVANNFKDILIQEGVPENRIKILPCEVDLLKFKVDSQLRELKRKSLRFTGDNIVGVYVGKFGGIYYDQEAFEIFLEGFRYFVNRFRLIILSPQSYEEISFKLKQLDIPIDYCLIDKVSFDEIPNYLLAADFAFCLHKPHKISYAYSPVKNGEYWACGLPVLIPDGIGDDSQILKETGLGVVMEDINHPEKYFPQLEELIKANKKEEIRQLALKHRNPETTRKTYKKLINSLVNK